MERQALAVVGSGDIVFDWDVLRDRVDDQARYQPAARPAPEQPRRPGAATGCRRCIRTTATRSAPRSTSCWSIGAARVIQSFRLRGADGHYHWFSLRARPVVGSDGEVIRCVGTMVERDRAEEGRGTAAARRRARQSDRPAQPRAVPEPAARPSSRSPRSEDKIQPTVLRHRHRPLQAGQ